MTAHFPTKVVIPQESFFELALCLITKKMLSAWHEKYIPSRWMIRSKIILRQSSCNCFYPMAAFHPLLGKFVFNFF